MRKIASLLVLAVLASQAMAQASAPASKPAWPKPAPVDTSKFGKNIQHTMSLLATSTKDHHNTVRVLFYGQSISKCDYWMLVRDDLKKRFPNADLTVECRAIGGFGAGLLKKTVEMDVVPFQPDLVIFHVYGSPQDYEQIMKVIRSQTTAEVAIQNDHFGAQSKKKPNDPIIEDNWSRQWDNELLPAIAKKFNLELIDVRTAWRRYLTENKLAAQPLLADDIHLNDWGNFVMAQIVDRQLVCKPGLMTAESRRLVKSYIVSKDVQWKNGKLTLPFDGSRIDLVPAAGDTPGSAAVTIDGKKPSQFPAMYFNTRPNKEVDKDWPWWTAPPFRITHNTPWQEEAWTITVLRGNGDHFTFKVEGSKTGPDGEGTNKEKFVSKSGRIVIEPDDWWIPKNIGAGWRQVKPGYVLTFKTYLAGMDTYQAKPLKADGLDHAATVALNLSNGKHTLVLTIEGEGQVPLKEIRIYKPPMK